MSFTRSSFLLSPLRLASRVMSASGMDHTSEDNLPPKLVAAAPSPSSTDEATDVSQECLVDFVTKDYRGFLFVLHERLGLMLLHCTRKKAKGPHWQLPGGHIDDHEFINAAMETDVRKTQLQTACKRGAVRELFEETGIDVRDQLDRVKPISLYDNSNAASEERLENEFKDRLFYVLSVTDADFANQGVSPMNVESNLKLKLSVEHSGYTFEPEPKEAAKMVELHSGGKSSQALLMAMERDVLPARRSRRSKYHKEDVVVVAAREAPIDLLPPPRKNKTNMFCCLSFDNDDNEDMDP